MSAPWSLKAGQRLIGKTSLSEMAVQVTNDPARFRRFD
jgi:hypothetical protein